MMLIPVTRKLEVLEIALLIELPWPIFFNAQVAKHAGDFLQTFDSFWLPLSSFLCLVVMLRALLHTKFHLLCQQHRRNTQCTWITMLTTILRHDMYVEMNTSKLHV